MKAISEFKKHYREVKGEITGTAVSRARLVKNAKDIPGLLPDNKPVKGPAKPIAGAYIRMQDKKPMQFHTDGSLRHALGRKPNKAERKQFKRNRQAARRVIDKALTSATTGATTK